MPMSMGIRSFPHALTLSNTCSDSNPRTDIKKPAEAGFLMLPVSLLAALARGQCIFDLRMHAAYRLNGGIPVNTGVGDGHAVFQLRQILVDGLATPADVAFDHQADNG